MAALPYDEEVFVTPDVLRGPFLSGRGRANRRLASQIAEAIQRETSGCVRDLHVEVNHEGVILTGRCESYYMKQRAQHAAMGCSSDRLHNEIEVV